MKNSQFLNIYQTLLKTYGKQGWWPIINEQQSCSSNDIINECEQSEHLFKCFEICIGAILTQNTAWTNVEKALENLVKTDSINVKKIANMPLPKLQRLIKPSGFYKQKADRLNRFAKYVLSFDSVKSFCKNITREQLLAFNGIGQETADSILLYACNKPYFVIDAYTKRIFSRIGIQPDGLKGIHKHDYENWRMMFEQNIMNELQNNKINAFSSEKTSKELVKIYQEYHALIVELAKRSCKTKPECNGCVLNQCPSKTKTNSI